MRHALAVRVVQRIGKGAHDFGRLAEIESALSKLLFERAAFDEGRNNKGLFGRAANFMHAHDIVMVQRGRELRLANEPLAVKFGLQDLFSWDLDSDGAPELSIKCPVNDAE